MKFDMAGIDKLNWFCGDDNTENLINFTFDLNHTLYNACFVDLAYTLPHLAFLVLGVLVLFVLGCCTQIRRRKYTYLIPYPGHYLRWVLYILFVLLVISELGEGILTDLGVYGDLPTRPHLYVPGALSLVAALVSVVYYNQMEVWNRPGMAWLLLIYWLAALAGEVARFLNLDHDPNVDFSLMRLDLNIAALVTYALLLLFELHVIRTKVLKWCTTEERFPEDLLRPDMHYMQEYCNFLSCFMYSWIGWLYVVGYNHSLEYEDVGSLSEVHTTKYQSDCLNRALKKEQERARAKGTSLSMFRVYARAYGWDMFLAFLTRALGDTCAFVPPFAVAGVVSYVMSPEEAQESTSKYISAADFISNGFVLVVILFLATATRGVALQGHYQIVILASAHVQIALQAMVYDKSLRLASYTLTGGSMTVGQITNHMSVDALNVLEAFQILFYLFSVPYLCIGYLIILYYQLGVAALIGFFIVATIFPLSSFIAKKTGRFQKSALEKGDERLKRTNELLQGIKLIKLYGWEDMFYTAISKVRALEISSLLKQTAAKVFMLTLSNSCPLLVTLVSYSLYTTLTGKHLTPAVAFGSLAAFNQLFFPLMVLPYTLITTANAVVSTGRLKAFLAAPEIEEHWEPKPKVQKEVVIRDFQNDHKPEDRQWLLDGQNHEQDFGTFSPNASLSTGLTYVPDDMACRIDGSFTWDEGYFMPTLNNIELDIPMGKLTMIIGQVGAGKSSLLSALLGEMITVSGGVQWNRNCRCVAYGAQKPWLLNATLKDNVLFGNSYDKKRYKKVISACSLQPDIDILPAGDQTEIGEKGINLSGGQKQRVSVARAMYSENNIVILDDPLSALDAHVGSRLFKKGIEGFLMKKSKRTVILVTHQIKYAERADLIVYMKDGRIENLGNLEEIREENPELVATWTQEGSGETGQPVQSDSETSGNESASTVDEERAKLMRQVSALKQVDRGESKNAVQGRLVQDEERVKGAVSWRVYLTYVKAIGLVAFSFLLFFAVFQQALFIGTNFWLANWSEAGRNISSKTSEQQDRILHYYLSGYAGLSVSSVVAGAATITIVFTFTLLAGRRLHNQMLENIMHAPMRFFDTTPIGRIMNRFSSDIKTIDQILGNTFNSFQKYWLTCIGAIVVNIAVTWYFAVALIPFVILYLLIMKFFIRTSRELQRLYNISKSPVFAHFSETLGGLSTIRAYRQQEQFREGLINKMETNNTMFIYVNTSNRWLGARLEVIGGIIVLIAGLSTVISAMDGLLLPSLVGLALAYALNASNQLNWMIRSSANMEMQLNSIERVDYYKNVETEKYKGAATAPRGWPNRGLILFEGVSARYATELDPVLHDVNIHFLPGEKIGICGRTGSGKSSLMLTLFRLIQTFQGRIFVDGVNIASLPLLQLRSRLAIIPQDPVLFTGTIRFNLDARNEHDDKALWEALEIAQLKDVVMELDLKLNATVTEGGENFSVGQRQLFCLARAFLRKTRILVMDEATASIDLETDKILQRVVATAFQDRTVLTIAHRVQSILDSDRILVLSEGKVAEFDTPENLLAKEDSIFSSLVKAGI
ncbi:ATP-binding cassette sub-family C member 8-like isoform X2 [Acanthaster planci]|uniref:ATP-binding cassette sub-family C member 8-like isoform X2 n=1 Tax=Acanthaster planci TaxID=133434 RepID=A0A8B7XLN2_ACAPL|nr:ATP-binding cassette sub-family C member 8-like isoform X2 [Acanthaster planci]